MSFTRRRSNAASALVALAAAVIGIALPAAAQDVRKVALAGEPAPGTEGQSYFPAPFLEPTPFGAVEINDLGQIAFGAWITSQSIGQSISGTFLESSGTVELLIDQGTPFDLALNNHGDVVIHGGTGLGGDSMITRIRSGEDPVEIAADGDPAPGTKDGSYRFGAIVNNRFSINDAGQVAFRSDLDPFPPPQSGIFLSTDGVIEPVVLSVDGFIDLPRTSTAGRFMNAAGRILVFDSTPLASVLHTFDDDVISALVASGDDAPKEVGGTFSAVGTFGIASTGDAVAFAAEVEKGSAEFGIFVDLEGSRIVAALEGDGVLAHEGTLVLGSGPRRVTPLSVNRNGQVAFIATLDGPGENDSTAGIFSSADGLVTVLVAEGDTAPGTHGGVFDRFESLSLNEHGQVAFNARVTGGTLAEGEATESGIFVVPSPSASAQGIASLMALFALRRARSSASAI